MKRRVLLIAWLMALAACPIGLVAVACVYPDVPSHPPPYPTDRPPQRWAEALALGQGWVTLITAALVPLVSRSWPLRLLAWLGVLIVLGVTSYLCLAITFSKTGQYL